VARVTLRRLLHPIDDAVRSAFDVDSGDNLALRDAIANYVTQVWSGIVIGLVLADGPTGRYIVSSRSCIVGPLFGVWP